MFFLSFTALHFVHANVITKNVVYNYIPQKNMHSNFAIGENADLPMDLEVHRPMKCKCLHSFLGPNGLEMACHRSMIHPRLVHSRGRSAYGTQWRHVKTRKSDLSEMLFFSQMTFFFEIKVRLKHFWIVSMVPVIGVLGSIDVPSWFGGEECHWIRSMSMST